MYFVNPAIPTNFIDASFCSSDLDEDIQKIKVLYLLF